jgi:hypothetical protein
MRGRSPFVLAASGQDTAALERPRTSVTRRSTIRSPDAVADSSCCDLPGRIDGWTSVLKRTRPPPASSPTLLDRIFGTLAAGWFIGLHLSATASGFMALFAPTLFLIFLFAQSYPVAVVLVVLWGLRSRGGYPTLPSARTKSCARGAGVFQQSLQFLRKSRFDGRNDDWRIIHCFVWDPRFAARQHRTPGGGRPYLSSGTVAQRATGSHALNLAAE